jgi:hypothetical protein
MTLHTLNNSQIEDLNTIVSKWHGKIILKTNITEIKLDQLGNICSIENETSHKSESPSAERFHIYSPKINENSFTYKTDKGKDESEEISGLWLDPQGDFMVTSPHPLKVEINDASYIHGAKTHLVYRFGMLIFRSKTTELKEINQRFIEFMAT